MPGSIDEGNGSQRTTTPHISSSNNSNNNASPSESQLVAFQPLPADQQPSYSSTLMNYVRKFAGKQI